MKDIDVPAVEIDDADSGDVGKVNFATECAFNEMVHRALLAGLPIQQCVDLMYLSDQAITRQFQDACRAVLNSLKVTP